jgi:hypothetical protein
MCMVFNSYRSRWKGIYGMHSARIRYAQLIFRSEMFENVATSPHATCGRTNQQDEPFVSSSCSNFDVDSEVGNIGDQLQENFRCWLSPPDPSANHSIARSVHHDGTTSWFIQGYIFNEWKTTGSLLWIRGNRRFPSLLRFFILIVSCIVAGSGKSVLWYVMTLLSECFTHFFRKLNDHSRCPGIAKCWAGYDRVFLFRLS